MRRHATKWMKTFAKHTFDKRLLSKIYNELLKYKKAKSLIKKWSKGGFPSGAVVENLPANAGDTGSSPGLGRSHMPRSN